MARHPELETAEAQYKAFEKYLESLGYAVKKSQRKVMMPANEIPDEYRADFEKYAEWDSTGESVKALEYDFELIKDGVSVILGVLEYDDLEQETRKAVEFFLWKKRRDETE